MKENESKIDLNLLEIKSEGLMEISDSEEIRLGASKASILTFNFIIIAIEFLTFKLMI